MDTVMICLIFISVLCLSNAQVIKNCGGRGLPLQAAQGNIVLYKNGHVLLNYILKSSKDFKKSKLKVRFRTVYKKKVGGNEVHYDRVLDFVGSRFTTFGLPSTIEKAQYVIRRNFFIPKKSPFLYRNKNGSRVRAYIHHFRFTVLENGAAIGCFTFKKRL